MKTSINWPRVVLAGILLFIIWGAILAAGLGAWPMQQRIAAPTPTPAPCDFATARCSPAGGDAFTDSDGLRWQTDRALWECYWEARRQSQRTPYMSLKDLQRLYWTCIYDYGIVV